MSLKTLGLALLAGLSLAGTAVAQVDIETPIYGGQGGSRFSARCAAGDILNGIEIRTGDDVDAIRPICATPSSMTSIGARYAFSQSFGGSGGETRQYVCPDAKPAVLALRLGAEGQVTVILNQVEIYCGVIVPNAPLPEHATAGFTGEWLAESLGTQSQLSGMDACPNGVMPVGLVGRSGIWLDALGLICGRSPLVRETPVVASPITAIGRVGGPDNSPRPQRSVCDAAADARARRSPAAANLEAQCQALGGPTKVRPSDADFEIVRSRGEVIAANDDRADNLRNRLGAAQRVGFDVGLGIWSTDVAPGPGKQRFHDFLDAVAQQGFDIAAAYALPRNRYAASIAVATLINKQDGAVRAARASVDNGFYWLGFDIASGLFGPKSLGALGSKVLGSGAIAIRNSLEANAQNGFNDSMALHLSRNYP